MTNKLYEYMSPNRGHLIVEGHGHPGKLCMKGTFIQADIRNQNQRIYPLKEISSAVDSLMERISSGFSILGELDHPEELTINLDRVSHSITEMWMDDANGCGKLNIIETTPMGQIAKGLLESNIKLGVSSRGSGDVSHNGDVSGFEIVTIDIVAQPSAPEAYPTSIYESLYNMTGGGAIHRIAQGAALGETSAQKHLQKELIRFVKDLKIET